MPLLSSLHRLRLPSLALTILLLALAVVPATAAPAPLARLFGPPAARAACGLPLVHDHYVGFHIGVPAGGYWKESLNSDGPEYGGSGLGNLGGREVWWTPSHGHPFTLSLTVTPLAMVVFKRIG